MSGAPHTNAADLENRKSWMTPPHGEPADRSPTGPNAEEEPTGLFTWSNFLISIPSILIPILYGYEIGFVGVYALFYQYATDCEMYLAQKPCETLSATNCAWRWTNADPLMGRPDAGYMCQWAEQSTCYLLYSTTPTCVENPDCVWDYRDKVCRNQIGYTSSLNGLFAGSMIMGAMVGSLIGGRLTKRLNFRLSFFLIGAISTIASVMTHISTGIFEYWLLFVARIVLGFAMGWQAVAAPAYVDLFAPKAYQKTIGTFFQVFTAFGSFVASLVGIILGKTISYTADRDAMLMARMQGFTCITTFLSILVMLLYFLVMNTSDENSTDNSEPDKNGKEVDVYRSERKYSIFQMIGPLLIGVAMGCTLQLTGINAMMNYAPIIMRNLGLDPFVGNILVVGWNSLTAFGVIPLSKYFTMRTLFLFFTLCGSLACLLLCGVPVYPGVTKSKEVKEGVAITGIAVFIAAYEFGIGPCFFVLSRDVFPLSFRPIGSSFTVGVMFIFNLIINICYPIATEGLSGGPSGNQDKGQAIVFMFFGCIGLVTVTIEYFYLHPYPEDDNEIVDPEGTA